MTKIKSTDYTIKNLITRQQRIRKCSKIGLNLTSTLELVVAKAFIGPKDNTRTVCVCMNRTMMFM